MTQPKARALLVDWPWMFDDKIQGGRGAESKYRCMSFNEALIYELPPIEDDALMVFWRVAAMQREALDIVEAWGFEVKSELVWVKTTGSDDSKHVEELERMVADGFLLPREAAAARAAIDRLQEPKKLHFGMGHYTRGAHEAALVCTRGRFKVVDRAVRSVFHAPMPRDAHGAVIHSAKPDEVYDIIERLSGRGPYCELFARRRRAGWLQHGDELPVESEDEHA